MKRFRKLFTIVKQQAQLIAKQQAQLIYYLLFTIFALWVGFVLWQYILMLGKRGELW